MDELPVQQPLRLEAGCGEAWCSLQFRLDGDELDLLRYAEGERGAQLVRQGALAQALELAKAGKVLRGATPGAVLVLDEASAYVLGAAALAVADAHPRADALRALADRLLGPLSPRQRQHPPSAA